ncbi:MAG TPA: hypothetical protein PLD47_01125 [Aggregatilineales bacterium]|nr:16S rRNA methyltransferase [Anaerolineales bacterium]HRE46300.1 hypothetical protein [Aggregatilineales bacterium]
MSDPNDPLERIVLAVRESAKYHAVHKGLIRAVGAAELAKRPSLKEAIKATKNKLHQVGAAYFGAEIPYTLWQMTLAQATDRDSGKETIQAILRLHASTRERLPIMTDFYTAIFGAITDPVRQVIDVACGLNPLMIPFMPLPPEIHYQAFDVYEDMITFLNGAFRVLGINGEAHLADALRDPLPAADLAFVLKAIPCLEQLAKDAGRILLDRLRARWIVVSYPAQSLGGRGKGMAASYETHFNALIAGRGWKVTPLRFSTEIAFVVRTDHA